MHVLEVAPPTTLRAAPDWISTIPDNCQSVIRRLANAGADTSASSR